jgi:UDP-N-acetyl-D-mannosaminuronic acid dehydrogenase
MDAVDIVVIMVKHNEIKEKAEKLQDKIVLDCHNIIGGNNVYHI